MGRPRLEAARGRLGGLATDAAWGMGTEVAKLAASLGVFYILTTRLGPEGYGLYAGIHALAATLAILGGNWMALVLIQAVIREGRPVADMIAVALGPTVFGGALVTVVATVVGPLLLPGVSRQLIAVFTAAEVFSLGVALVGIAAIQATRGFASATRVRIILSVGRLVTVIVVFALGQLSLPVLGGALLVTNGLFAAGVLTLVGRSLDVPIRLRIPGWTDLRSGLSYAGISAVFAVQEDSDKVLMVRLGSPFDAGIYAAGYRVTQMALLPIRALLSSTHNRFLQHDPTVKWLHLRRSLRFSAVAGGYGITASLILFFGAPLLVFVVGGDYDDAMSVVRWVAPLVALRSLSLVPSNGLMGLRRNGARLAILVGSAVVNVGATAALIPRHSWRGAAMGTIAAEVLFLVGTWAALIYYQRRDDRDRFGRPAMATTAS